MVRDHPIFKRILTLIDSNVQWTEDIFGCRKDFQFRGGNTDNEFVFRTLERKKSLNDVVIEVCQEVGNELRELIVMKEALIHIFGEDDDHLLDFLNLIDTLIDGQFLVYAMNPRFRFDCGLVRLSRELGSEMLSFSAGKDGLDKNNNKI